MCMFNYCVQAPWQLSSKPAMTCVLQKRCKALLACLCMAVGVLSSSGGRIVCIQPAEEWTGEGLLMTFGPPPLRRRSWRWSSSWTNRLAWS